MPTVGEEITRNGKTFKYTGYGHWSQVVEETTVTGDVPLPDGAASHENQEKSLVNEMELDNSIGKLIKQLKINNMHLSLVTGEEIDKTEIT